MVLSDLVERLLGESLDAPGVRLAPSPACGVPQGGSRTGDHRCESLGEAGTLLDTGQAFVTRKSPVDAGAPQSGGPATR